MREVRKFDLDYINNKQRALASCSLGEQATTQQSTVIQFLHRNWKRFQFDSRALSACQVIAECRYLREKGTGLVRSKTDIERISRFDNQYNVLYHDQLSLNVTKLAL
jgi:hypothetical protein